MERCVVAAEVTAVTASAEGATVSYTDANGATVHEAYDEVVLAAQAERIKYKV